jgi:hypothetical protein
MPHVGFAEAPVAQVQVDLGRADISVAEQHLDDADIDTGIEQSAGEGVAERVRIDGRDAGGLAALDEQLVKARARQRVAESSIEETALAGLARQGSLSSLTRRRNHRRARYAVVRVASCPNGL